MADVIHQLAREIHVAILKLATANRQLETLLTEKQQQISRDANSLQIVREALQQIPLAVIAVDNIEMIAFANNAAAQLLHHRGHLLGSDVRDLLPEITTLLPFTDGATSLPHIVIDGQPFQPRAHAMGIRSQSYGTLITLTPVATAVPILLHKAQHDYFSTTRAYHC